MAAYRIVQEALTNVHRHANAGCAEVRLYLNGDLHVTVGDDGVGLPRTGALRHRHVLDARARGRTRRILHGGARPEGRDSRPRQAAGQRRPSLSPASTRWEGR
ncbi:ATP-binding protein [Actinomadura madurae]|uniref:ATP-binding protein n=1 Tax=Actinomadura madurae TaxID=1993 RepID=UPI0020D220A5|nr:ATP-binding protein [Actinomadura madurae]MCQ0020043.1 hypothetical protein [Actinomadura madurae]